MINLSEEEQYLLLGKVTNSLSEGEKKDLDILLLKNQKVWEVYEDLIRQLPLQDIANSFERLKQPEHWKDLNKHFQEHPVIRLLPIYKKFLAAAVFIGVCVIGVLIWNQLKNRNNLSTATAVTKKITGIQLKMADGKVINLSAAQGGINAGAAQLNNTNKTLTYSVNSGAVPNNEINSLIVPVGMDYKINLSDGTEVWLNAATQMKFPLAFTGNTREITINGEAFLKVAKNLKKPFIVHLPNTTVQVLGTEFNVNTYDSGVVKVALVKGSVNMHASTGDSKLVPGIEAISSSGTPIKQQAFDSKIVLSWRNGLFYFEEASLTEISKVTPRWFGIEVVIDNPSLYRRRFTGVLNRNQPLSVFLEDLKAISNIDSYIDKGKVLHFK
jgi:transmembrane sensor